MAAGTGLGSKGIGRRGLEGETTAVGLERGKEERGEKEGKVVWVVMVDGCCCCCCGELSKVGKLVGRSVSDTGQDPGDGSSSIPSSSLSISVMPVAAAREV